MFEIFQKNMTFQNVKIEILKCAWDTVSACPQIQIWGTLNIGKLICVGPSLAPSDLIWVTLGQDAYCMRQFS